MAASCASTINAALPMRDVWAIGDLVGEPLLAHKAMAQGEMVARDHRWSPTPFRSGGDRGGLLHRTRNRQRGTRLRRRSEEHRYDKRDVSLLGKRPRAVYGRSRRGRLRARAGRRATTVFSGIQAGGRPCLRARGEFAPRSRNGPPCSRTSRNIHVHPTLGEACTKTHCARSGHRRCTSESGSVLGEP